jgi:hypothetical protein
MQTEPIPPLAPRPHPSRVTPAHRDAGRRFAEAWRRARQQADAEPDAEAPAPSVPAAQRTLQSPGPAVRRDPDGAMHVDVLA